MPLFGDDGNSYEMLQNADVYKERRPDKDFLAIIEFGMDVKQVQSQRSFYGIFDLLGDVGGLHDILANILGLIVGPFAANLWLVRAIKLLYAFKGPVLQEQNKSEAH